MVNLLVTMLGFRRDCHDFSL